MASKIKVSTPLVEIQGDEMTRIIWDMIKQKFIQPHLDINLELYDLGLLKRDDTNDQITKDAAEAIKKYKVGVKCATITPNKAQVQEFNLKRQYTSPNGQIRAALDGTVFRSPVMCKNIAPLVSKWVAPISIGRHAYGDVYKNQEIRTEGKGVAKLVWEPEGGEPQVLTIMNMKGDGIIQGIHNTDESIRSFARASFTYGLDQNIDVWFAAKDTISRIYDQRFRDIFQEIFETEFKDKFAAAGIEYSYTLIDDAVARVVKREKPLLWACKNYDGDVQSDFVASAYGSLGMMKSVLCSPQGFFEYEAAHGTVARHYKKHLAGEKTSTNSVATMFAWTGGLKKRGELDNNCQLVDFANKWEAAITQTIEDGYMTGDLIPFASGSTHLCDTETFLDEVYKRLVAKL